MRRPALVDRSQQRTTEPPAAAPETVEQEINRLTGIRAGLAAQLAPLEQAKAEATARRRELLLAPGAGDDAKAEASRACREREGEVFAIADAIEEADRRLADATARRDAAALAAERERVAARLERNAGEIITATAAMGRALDGLAKAHAMLAITVSGTSAPLFRPHSGIDSPTEIASAILMESIVSTLTGIGIAVQLRDMGPLSYSLPVEAIDPTETAAAFGERLRETARQVRAGETDVDLPAHQEAEPDFTPENPELQVYVLTPFSYIGAHRGRVMVAGATASLPVPVAEKAIEVGVASEAPTREWQKAENRSGSLTEVHARPSVSWEECVNIGFDLAAWRRAEAERRREAWRAERQPEAA